MNKHEFLNNIVKRVLPGYEIVKKKPPLNSFSLVRVWNNLPFKYAKQSSVISKT